jgi:dephospho-CoA kinase
MAAPSPVVGLTGGIGSGKARWPVSWWARRALIDADKIGPGLSPGTEGFRPVEAFGPGVVAADGTIDRRALGAIVFGDAAARMRLNSLVHPLIGVEIARRIEAARAEGGRS